MKRLRPCDLITLPCCRRSHSRPGFPVAVPLICFGLPTSGSDEPNWKHVLHAGSHDRWDNIILLMTERERGRAEGGGEEWNPPSSKGLLVLNSSTLSCCCFWGSYYRKAARLCLHMEYPLNPPQYSAGLAPVSLLLKALSSGPPDAADSKACRPPSCVVWSEAAFSLSRF